MPVLFAATLFVSASLLFMVQPMVAKMVLPLLGGSPAVWNACMVFFQALLLLGYLYSHHISGKYSPRKQWMIHLLVLGLPLAAFFLAVSLGTRHSPIAIVESLAPGEGSSPVLRVLLLLTHSDRRAVPGRLDQRALAPEVVHLHRSPVVPRPVLPLCGQQLRQHDLAPGLSALHRAEPEHCGSGVGLRDRLRDTGRDDRRLRLRRGQPACGAALRSIPAGKQSGKGSQGKLPRTERKKRRQLRKQVDSQDCGRPASKPPPSLARKLKWIAAGLRPFEHDARRHVLHDHRHRQHSLAVGRDRWPSISSPSSSRSDACRTGSGS